MSETPTTPATQQEPHISNPFPDGILHALFNDLRYMEFEPTRGQLPRWCAACMANGARLAARMPGAVQKQAQSLCLGEAMVLWPSLAQELTKPRPADQNPADFSRAAFTAWLPKVFGAELENAGSDNETIFSHMVALACGLGVMAYRDTHLLAGEFLACEDELPLHQRFIADRLLQMAEAPANLLTRDPIVRFFYYSYTGGLIERQTIAELAAAAQSGQDPFVKPDIFSWIFKGFEYGRRLAQDSPEMAEALLEEMGEAQRIELVKLYGRSSISNFVHPPALSLLGAALEWFGNTSAREAFEDVGMGQRIEIIRGVFDFAFWMGLTHHRSLDDKDSGCDLSEE